VHEFAHGIHLCGLNNTSFNSELVAVYSDAVDEGLWEGTYAISNSREYFAELTQSYFGVNFDGVDQSHNGINGGDELLDYDPDGYYLIDSVFGQQD
jgi:hypothetical protein